MINFWIGGTRFRCFSLRHPLWIIGVFVNKKRIPFLTNKLILSLMSTNWILLILRNRVCAAIAVACLRNHRVDDLYGRIYSTTNNHYKTKSQIWSIGIHAIPKPELTSALSLGASTLTKAEEKTTRKTLPTLPPPL